MKALRAAFLHGVGLVCAFSAFWTTVANAALFIEYEERDKAYAVKGNIDEGVYTVTWESKTTIPYSRNIIWPTRDGVYMIVTYMEIGGNFFPSFDPVFLRKSLAQTEVPDGKLPAILNESFELFGGGYTLKFLEGNRVDTVSFMVCDYRRNKATWPCKGARSGSAGITLPPPVVPALTCSISSSIELQHGDLAMDSVEGDRSSTTAYVSCNREAKVSVAAAPHTQGIVELTGVSGLRSELSINGTGGGQKVSMTANTFSTAVRVESVLHTDGAVTAGVFRGGSYLVLSIP